MHNEEVPNAGNPSENGETLNPNAQGTPEHSISHKYRELKARLKYLIYEHRCFESELSKAQGKLLDLSHDKTVLLDQLLQYEPMSGEEETVTDYSGSEDEVAMDNRLQRPVPPAAAKQQSGESSEKSSLSLKAAGSVRQPSRSPARDSPGPAPKPSTVATKQGIAKATAILNSTSNSIAAKVSKAGTKRQAKQASKSATAGTAVKISKTVSRVRQNDVTSVLLGAGGATGPGVVASSADGKPTLVVSYPITSISATPVPVSLLSTISTLTVTTISSSSSLAMPSSSSKPFSRPLPALTTTQPPPPPPLASSSLLIPSVSSVHVATITTPGAAPPPPLIPDTGKGRGQHPTPRSSSGSTTSSVTSSSSESGDSASDLSSGSDDEETMDTGGDLVGGGGMGKGPVRIVSSVKSSSDLPRPKAIMSPVKMTPPMLMKVGVPTPPPTAAVVSPQPAFTGWGQPSQGGPGAEGGPSLMEVGGFASPSPLASPSSALPFSSLNNPGASVSAFQVFSPKHAAPSSQNASSSASCTQVTTPTATVEATPTYNSASHSATKS